MLRFISMNLRYNNTFVKIGSRIERRQSTSSLFDKMQRTPFNMHSQYIYAV